jgi:hypothetical protein
LILKVLEHKPYDHKADVYSFGITMWYAFCTWSQVVGGGRGFVFRKMLRGSQGFIDLAAQFVEL